MQKTTSKNAIATKQHKADEKQPVRWYSEDELSNEIIQAYNNFKSSLKAEIKNTFDTKLEIAKDVCEKIYHALNNDKNIKCKKIYLRCNSLISLDAIVVMYCVCKFSTHLSIRP